MLCYCYRLCIVFLTFSCIGYAMPFILCGMICCCLPLYHFNSRVSRGHESNERSE
ncbi:hypothetical protein Hdeb2414_s1070g00978021 [Helianthus debilis subsp. tardiflorus]